MKFSRNKKLFILGTLLAIIIAIPLTVFFIRQQQQGKSKATASTTLSFAPLSTQAAPLSFKVGDEIPLSIFLNPGSNIVSSLTLDITYDPTKLEPAQTGAFSQDTSIFPTILEGPAFTPGRIQVTLTVGSDITRAVKTTTNIASVRFKALSGDPSPVVVRFGTGTEVYSIASGDSFSENVLSTTSPAYLSIPPIVTPTAVPPTPTLTVTPPPLTPTRTPTPTLTPTLTPTRTPTPSPTPIVSSLVLTVALHGIGSSGDNTSPNNSSSSTKNPVNPTRQVTVELINTQTTLLTGNITYVSQDGLYRGTILLPSDFVDGSYQVRISTPGHLRKLLVGNQTIRRSLVNTLTPVTLVTADADGDNKLSILDYNALSDCGFFDPIPLPMTDPNSTYNSTACKAHTTRENVDMNDDGVIDLTDYSLFFRELNVQNGD